MNKFAAMRFGQFCLGLITVAFFFQCASKATPPGGPKDETPPAIVQEKSTTNEQTLFKERSFIVTLNEWVKLEDVQSQVLISPPLERRPEIKIKGKSVVFKFHEDEVLKEGATYTVNFGDAIQDITENNPLKNFSFVFSTGSVIDSLSINGNVIDAYTAEPVEDATVMVYESLEDSIPLQEKPLYATKSDEEGAFEIRNMKAGIFKIVAITDDNLNYLLDGVERVAFLDTTFHLDTAGTAPINLRMSQPLERLYPDRRDTSEWNKAVFTYNRYPYGLSIDYADPDQTLFYDLLNNTLSVWYYDENRREWPLYFSTGEVLDTFVLNYNAPNQKQTKPKELSRLKNSGFPSDPFYHCFDRPILSFDTSFIQILEGSTAKKAVNAEIFIIDSLPLCLQFAYQWQPDSTYELILLPGSLTDLYDLTNDTISQRFPIGNVERFGSIIMKIEGLSNDQSYLIQLGIKDKPEYIFSVDSTTTFERTITKLKPATYDLRIVEDRNRNGRWDPGDLLLNRQPEVTRKYEIEQLRANWDVDVNVKME
ncbi:MAG: hypothetical protein HKN76_13405 [Saprospiraceae bacterium]|nr:hypothetical protein [Saprospiraceae bacterium]